MVNHQNNNGKLQMVVRSCGRLSLKYMVRILSIAFSFHARDFICFSCYD